MSEDVHRRLRWRGKGGDERQARQRHKQSVDQCHRVVTATPRGWHGSKGVKAVLRAMARYCGASRCGTRRGGRQETGRCATRHVLWPWACQRSNARVDRAFTHIETRATRASPAGAPILQPCKVQFHTSSRILVAILLLSMRDWTGHRRKRESGVFGTKNSRRVLAFSQVVFTSAEPEQN